MKDRLDELLNVVKNSSKYRHIDEDLIRSVGEEQLKLRKNFKESVKFTKSKLHQIGAVYFEGKPNYEKWETELSKCDDKNAIQKVCKEIMMSHASTRERLPILEDFYTNIFSHLPTPKTILDIACGLNPLAIPWMNLNKNVNYIAIDIFYDLSDFLNRFFKIIGVSGNAYTCDILNDMPVQQADTAFILKSIPCLEQLNNSASDLLDRTPAKNLVVSFPVSSLTGKSKGMITNYDEHFQKLVLGKGWNISKLIFSTELVFMINKQ